MRLRSLWVPFLLFCMVASFATGIFLVLHNLRSNFVYFVPPSALLLGKYEEGEHLRVGGIVVRNTVLQDKTSVTFRIRDFENKEESFLVQYDGPLPSLFAEGQGVLIDGYYRHHRFYAKRLLARHDETYRP